MLIICNFHNYNEHSNMLQI